MGKANAGSWKDMQQDGAGTPPPPVGWVQLETRPDGDQYVAAQCCLQCGAESPERVAGPEWNQCPDDGVMRWEHCTFCGVMLAYRLALRCPKCGYAGCFEAKVAAWVHVGPTYAPHDAPWLEDDWNEHDTLIACGQCRVLQSLEDYLPARDED